MFHAPPASLQVGGRSRTGAGPAAAHCCGAELGGEGMHPEVADWGPSAGSVIPGWDRALLNLSSQDTGV